MVAGGGDAAEEEGPADVGADEVRQKAAAMELGGTMMVPKGFDISMIAGGGTGKSGSTANRPLEEAREDTERLEYLCQLLRRARQPVVPINGVLTLVPFPLIKRGADVCSQLQAAAKNDLNTVSRRFQLRYPVAVMISSMEAEDGFKELVRRVGPDEAKKHRFGKGYHVWSKPLPERIEAVGTHACGAFEDWTYSLFRQRDGLNHPGNRKLYSLLCTIRSRLRRPLIDLLANAFGRDAERDPDKEIDIGFSGCYFAATGSVDDRQAFVQSVFRKLQDFEEELDWTDQALIENERYRRLAGFASLVCGLFIASWIGMLLVKFVILR
jgi:hypothetical protein